MPETVRISDNILDYAVELGKIQEQLQDAYTYAVYCCGTISEEETYQGEAKAELQLFFYSLADHLKRMILLYQAAGAYAINAYDTVYHTDQQMKKWSACQTEE